MNKKALLVILFCTLFAFQSIAAADGDGDGDGDADGQRGGSTMSFDYNGDVKVARVSSETRAPSEDEQNQEEQGEEEEAEMTCGVNAARVAKIEARLAELVDTDEDFAKYVLFRLEDWLAKSTPGTHRYCLVEMLAHQLRALLGMEDDASLVMPVMDESEDCDDTMEDCADADEMMVECDDSVDEDCDSEDEMDDDMMDGTDDDCDGTSDDCDDEMMDDDSDDDALDEDDDDDTVA
ncbi:MAG: hypothetical protein H6765_08710 [Candidatus Peribacteria bacterium]|nr:MAG: hypothetical protein H6765_08710 [Candidatus Peribacteria bacterium]